MIDLADYTRNRRKWLRRVGAHCVFVICADGENPCKIGGAYDPVSLLNGLQAGNSKALRYVSLLWCPGEEVSDTIEALVRKQFENFHMLRNWFQIEPPVVDEAVRAKAAELYPTLPFFDHKGIIEHLRKQRIEKDD